MMLISATLTILWIWQKAVNFLPSIQHKNFVGCQTHSYYSRGLIVGAVCFVLIWINWSYCSSKWPSKPYTTATHTPNLARKMAAQNWPKVMLFGDSITQRSFGFGNWGSQIADNLQRKCDVLNRGFSGYNSRWNRIILPKLLTEDLAAEIEVLTILIGSNDANSGQANPQQHVPLNEYKENVLKMVEYAKSVGVNSEKIIIMTPPPVEVRNWNKYCKENDKCAALDLNTVGLYAQAAREVASSQTVACLDLFLELQKEPNWQNLLVDGLHLSEAGGDAVAKLLWPLIHKRTKHLPEMFPLWSIVDTKNPQNSFS